MKLINTDSTHWYTRQGMPMHSILSKKGEERPTTLRDARKYDLLPSVTNVLGVIAKEQLINWRIEQAVLSSLTLPRKDGEDLDTFARRVVEDAKARTTSAADFGTEMHAGAQRVVHNPMGLSDKETAYPWLLHYRDWVTQNVERVIWTEKTLVNSAEGYAGTADLFIVHRTLGLCLVDIKTQGVKAGYKARAYPSWCYQLAAYRQVIDPKIECINLLVNSTVPEPVIEHRWTQEELAESMEVFRCAARIWRWEKGFDPRKPLIDVETAEKTIEQEAAEVGEGRPGSKAEHKNAQ